MENETHVEKRIRERKDWDELLVYHPGGQPQHLDVKEDFTVGDGYITQTIKDSMLPSGAPRNEQEWKDAQTGKSKPPGAVCTVHIDLRNASRIEFYKRTYVQTTPMIIAP